MTAPEPGSFKWIDPDGFNGASLEVVKAGPDKFHLHVIGEWGTGEPVDVYLDRYERAALAKALLHGLHPNGEIVRGGPLDIPPHPIVGMT